MTTEQAEKIETETAKQLKQITVEGQATTITTCKRLLARPTAENFNLRNFLQFSKHNVGYFLCFENCLRHKNIQILKTHLNKWKMSHKEYLPS